ncbi:MAG: hypothetical protein ACYTG6_08905, partial [Planctomycetota bacterium]
DGAGTYALRVRWHADLRRRLTAIVGPEAMARCEGRAFPLDAATWREGLEACENVVIEALEEVEAEGGWREISLRIRFTRLEDLLAWELLSRRTFDLRFVSRATGDEVTAERVEEGDHAELRMQPFTHLPVLDPLARALEALAAGDPRTPEASSRQEASPFDRWGVERARADRVQTILAPQLETVRLTVTVRPSGAVTHVGGVLVDTPDEAVFALDFDAIRRREDRAIRMRWRPRLLDRVVRIRQVGDAPDATTRR